jgi:hypothetical protein
MMNLRSKPKNKMVLAQLYNRNNSNSVTGGGPNFNMDVTKTNNNLMTLQAQLGK